MSLETLIAQFLLATVLFFVANWIGRHSISSGYHELSLFEKVDEAPAFNFVFRTLAPVVYYILTAALLNAIGLHHWTDNYYLVVVDYFVVRWLFNLVIGRASLMSWPLQLTTAITASGFAYYLYEDLVARPENLLPDVRNLGNEIWLLVILYVYSVANRLPLTHVGAAKRRASYLRRQFSALRERYDSLIREHAQSAAEQALVYSVLIYESFNRPRIYRWLERFIVRGVFGRGQSFGVMQVQSAVPLNDADSVLQGTKKVVAAYRSAIPNSTRTTAGSSKHDAAREWYALLNAVGTAAKGYNIRSDYPTEIESIFELIARKEYGIAKDLETGG